MTKRNPKNRFIGLMRKDWALMVKQLRLLAIYLALMMIIFSFTMDGTAALNSMFSVLMFMMAINCFAYDEQVHFEKLVAASPVPPLTVVLARYGVALTVGIGGSVVITLINLAAGFIRKAGSGVIEEALISLFASIGVALLLVSVLFPLFYKFGVNKSRIVMLMICAVPVLGILLVKTLLPEGMTGGVGGLSVPPVLTSLLPWLIGVLILAGTAFSVFLSVRILKNKQY